MPPFNGSEQAYEVPQSAVLNGNEEHPWVNVLGDTYGPQAQVPMIDYVDPNSKMGVNCTKENVMVGRHLAAQAQEAMDFVEMQTAWVEFGGKLADLPENVKEAGMDREDAAVKKMREAISLTPYDDINSVLLFANEGLEDMGLHFAFKRESGVVSLLEDDQVLWELAKSDRKE